MYEDAIKAV